jgi:hypothetical protein
MRTRGIFALLFANFLWAAPSNAQEDKAVETLQTVVGPREIAKIGKLVLESRIVDTSLRKVELITLRVPPSEQYGFRLMLPAAKSSDGASLGRFKQDNEMAIAVFTGGFLETYSPARPSGLVQHDGAVLTELRDDPIMTGVICYSNESGFQVRVMDSREFVRGKTAGDCIQTGPFLIKNGNVYADLSSLDESLPGKFPFSRKPFRRAFLLLDAQNSVVIGITPEDPISLFALRELFLRLRAKGGFEAKTAVALSGARTAGLIVQINGRDKEFGSTQTLLPNAVVIEER